MVALPTEQEDPFYLLDPTTNEHTIESSSQDVTLPYLPGLFDPSFLERILGCTVPSRPAREQGVPSHPFTTALRATANAVRTENNAPAFASTESATLDAFGTLDNNVPTIQVHSLIAKSWAEDPEVTLRIIWNLRSIPDGKSSKKGFYRAFGWLYKYHPKTAIGNLSMLVDRVVERRPKAETASGRPTIREEVRKGDINYTAESDEKEIMLVGMSHGYFKDLLNILVLAAADTLTSTTPDHLHPIEVPRIQRGERKKQPTQAEGKVARDFVMVQKQKVLKAKLSRWTDKSFRALYIAVARIFAKALSEDIASLNQIVVSKSQSEKAKLRSQLTTASVWAPTLQGAHDRSTNLGTAVAFVMYSNGDSKDLSKRIRTDSPLSSSDAQVLRSFYRRWILSPLRRFLEVPEVKMSANEWSTINYSRVPASCFEHNKKSFLRHDEARLIEYIKDVTSGKDTINGAAILPHNLVREAVKLQLERPAVPLGKTRARQHIKTNDTLADLMEMQWNAVLDELRQFGTLDNCMAVCDVSASMGNLSEASNEKRNGRVSPILVAVALSLVLARIAKPPFSDAFITFSSYPKIVTLSDPTSKLIKHIREMERADWGMHTNFNAVFTKLLLPMALEHKLKREDMVKRLFVFSDMQFDEAYSQYTYSLDPQTKEWSRQKIDGPSWATNHSQITKEFEEAGYDMPEIVYWNLAGRVAAKPVTKSTPGVSLLSGFSPNLMKIFMDEDESENAESEEWKEIGKDGEEIEKKETVKKRMTPGEVMNKALGKKTFDGLKVLD